MMNLAAVVPVAFKILNTVLIVSTSSCVAPILVWNIGNLVVILQGDNISLYLVGFADQEMKKEDHPEWTILFHDLHNDL